MSESKNKMFNFVFFHHMIICSGVTTTETDNTKNDSLKQIQAEFL